MSRYTIHALPNGGTIDISVFCAVHDIKLGEHAENSGRIIVCIGHGKDCPGDTGTGRTKCPLIEPV